MDGPSPSRAPRVLLVEDDPVLAYALVHELAELGAQVVVAGDGQAALRLLTDEILTLDLLVADLERPALDGLELVRLLRTSCGETELPILALADHVSREIQAQLQERDVGVVAKDAGLRAIAGQALRLLDRPGRLAAPGEPALEEERWTPPPSRLSSGPIGRLRW